jgi:chromate reductase
VADARVLLVPGSTRAGSSNVAALQAAADAAPAGVRAEVFTGLRELPAFVPDDEPPPVVAAFLQSLAAADGVLFSTPEYAGGLPGSLKNLLDWTVGGGELYGKPVGWLDVANPGRGAGARAQLITVLGYVGADVVPAACLALTLTRTAGGPVVPEQERPRLSAVLRALAARPPAE